MSLLDTFFGRRPKLPPGASYTIDWHDGAYVIRLVLAGQDAGPDCKRVGPAFSDIGEAGKYRDWLEGTGPKYRYPPGRV